MSKPARATISDVAKAAKTGKTSISRYLNGEKHLLSDALLARIEQAIADLDYRPSLMARGLKRGRTRLIGLIIADITNPYSVNVLSGIEAACREKGFTPLVCNTNNEVDQELHYLDLLRSYQVEGIVVNAVGMREEGLNRLQQSSLPMVLIDRKIPEFACDVVGLDNTQAATTATEHLIEQGFEAILFLSEPLGMVNTRRERLSAFRATLEETVHADVLLHVVDAASSVKHEQMEQVDRVLHEIDASGIPQILVMNKIDAAEELRAQGPRIERDEAGAVRRVFVSAIEGAGLGLQHLGPFFQRLIAVALEVGRIKAQQHLQQAVHKAGEQAPLDPVAEGYQNERHHAEQRDGAAVGQLIDFDVGQDGAQRNHQGAFYHNARFGVRG